MKIRWTIYLILLLCIVSCSTTKNLPDGETLYTGIHQITYLDHGQKGKKMRSDSTGVIISIANAAEHVNDVLKGNLKELGSSLNAANTGKDTMKLSKQEKKAKEIQEKADAAAFTTAQTEVNAVLEIAPNNSLFGSSYHRTPFPLGLWTYNSYVNNKSKLGKWMYKSFASDPILISSVNPDTRIKVGTNTLHNYGYFHGNVKYFIENKGKDGKKAKISYFVTAGKVFRLDSVSYQGFPATTDSIIKHTARETFLHKGDAFNVLNLTNEQNRLERLFRNEGYYYYRAANAIFLADSTAKPYKVQLVMTPQTKLSPRTKHRWYIGNTNITVLNHEGDSITKVWNKRGINIAYSGKKMPLHPIVWIQNIAHRPHALYRLDDQERTQEQLSSLGIFSQLNFNYMARDTTASCDTLDVGISAVIDKPYTTDFEMNVTSKNNDRIGPGMSLSLQRKNAFRGAELLKFKIFGSYEWRSNNESANHGPFFNSYELGSDLSMDYPHIVFPGINRRTFHFPTATSFSLNADWLNRAQYFNLFSIGVKVAYSWNKNNTSKHEIIPFSLSFDKLLNSTGEFDSIMKANPSLYVSMRNRFVPAMQYTYTYMSPSNKRNPLWWQLMVKEAGNLTSGIFALTGRKINEQNKNIFNNPFAQFIKVTSELHNTFHITRRHKIVTRLMAGVAYSYGNSDVTPYSDQFFCGGANSVRAFTIRTIGPGHYTTAQSKYSYLDQTGDLKLEANAEYRFPLFGNLNGALFLDAGNVWLIRKDEQRPGGEFEPSTFLNDIALGTGTGLRYDMGFLVLRLDLGIALHDPADTHKSGYYNIRKFSDGLALHFAVGYPF